MRWERRAPDMARDGLSRGDLLLLTAVLSAFGIVTSGYLAYQWYEAASSSWCDIDAFFSCSKVRESPYAAVAGIPTAFLGVGGFAVLLAFAGLALRGRDSLGPWSIDRWLLLFALLGAGIGVGLTFIEIFVIQAICILCAIGFALELGILAAVVLLVRDSSAASGSP